MKPVTPIESPFPYFGGKSWIAGDIWERFGKTDTYIEPFFGSGAMLLANPHWETCTEVVNDIDHFIANAWRALKHDPDQTAYWADYPVSETDLHARHYWLVTEGSTRIAKCASDPDFYCAKVAGCGCGAYRVGLEAVGAAGVAGGRRNDWLWPNSLEPTTVTK